MDVGDEFQLYRNKHILTNIVTSLNRKPFSFSGLPPAGVHKSSETVSSVLYEVQSKTSRIYLTKFEWQEFETMDVLCCIV